VINSKVKRAIVLSDADDSIKPEDSQEGNVAKEESS